MAQRIIIGRIMDDTQRHEIQKTRAQANYKNSVENGNKCMRDLASCIVSTPYIASGCESPKTSAFLHGCLAVASGAACGVLNVVCEKNEEGKYINKDYRTADSALTILGVISTVCFVLSGIRAVYNHCKAEPTTSVDIENLNHDQSTER